MSALGRYGNHRQVDGVDFNLLRLVQREAISNNNIVENARKTRIVLHTHQLLFLINLGTIRV